MTLQSRIAGAIKQVIPVPFAARDGYYLLAADAVMTELSLRREVNGEHCTVRYVTDWHTEEG